MSAIMFGCVICEMAFEEYDGDCVAAACGHVFHDACLQGSCMAYPVCPTCDSSLDPSDVFPVFLNNLGDGSGDTVEDLEDDLQHMQEEIGSMFGQQKKFKEKIQSLEKILAEKEKMIVEKDKKIGALQKVPVNGQQNVEQNDSLAEQLQEQKAKINSLEDLLNDAMAQWSFNDVSNARRHRVMY